MSFQPEVDICLPPEHSVCLVKTAPQRWDEYLDLDIPVLVFHSCGEWNEVLGGLRLAGLSENRDAHLVDSWGLVTPVNDELASPEEPWCIVLGWTHPEQGWRGKLPLSGQTFVVTREKSQGEQLLADLQSLGARAISLPTIAFREPPSGDIIAKSLEQLPQFDWLVFTSVNGVHYFFQRLAESEFDHRSLGNTKFACIGPKTAEALAVQGFRSNLVPESFVAESLLDAFHKEEGQSLEGLRILIPRAEVAREILPQTLRERGAEVVVAPVYQTFSPQHSASDLKAIPAEAKVLFTSSSTVTHWIESTGRTDLSCFCIGPITAKTAREQNLRIDGIASTHTVAGLLEELTKVCGKK